ncbi:hypothetical protein K431DRAFT_12077 [Polychaeton citri CBS 116435]|uniref:Transmembrane protein n=1 Tax=Polychaeton citri CBS 116435 TaxID=1314669 RepID=A0A9P4PZI6_9PEZI|nr:hypothetical protein K431DRAFT_12077 [Polychaeton citri CBS 116435]
MARGRGQGYLSYSAFVLLSVSNTVLSADPGLATPEDPFKGLWTISIDNGPAPPPDQGPPWSVNAIRDKGALPYEIVGVVVAYLGSIFLLGLLLLTVGRRSRLKAQTAAPAVEMVKPVLRTFDSSHGQLQNSPSHWYSPRKLASKRSGLGSIRSGVSNPGSPDVESVISFDTNVIELDKMKRNQEMERLYAAVMEQDERKSHQATTSVTEMGSNEMSPPMSPADGPPDYAAGAQMSPNFSRRNPPRLITDDPGLRHLRAVNNLPSPSSPYSQKSPIRAIYPPDMPQSAVSSQFPLSPRTPTFWSQRNGPHSPHFNPQVRGSRSTSVGSQASGLSSKRMKKGLRSLKISSPVPRSGDIADNSDGARTPLTPRVYNPGLPPEPPTAKTIDSYYASTPGTLRSMWPEDDDRIPDEEDEEQADTLHNLPQAHPQRSVPQISIPLPSPPRPATVRSTSSSSDLPFRQHATTPPQPPPPATNPNGALPFRQAQFPTLHSMNPISAGPMKTTFVETRARGFQRGPNSAALISAGLATPYSPYMPFTPLTPVTPHIMSRTERKIRQKEEKRGLLSALTEEDQVQDEGDIWGDGYS